MNSAFCRHMTQQKQKCEQLSYQYQHMHDFNVTGLNLLKLLNII